MKISSVSRIVKHLNLKTIRFNLKYFPFRIAVLLPVFINRHVFLKDCSGSIDLPKEFYSGMIKIGYGDVGVFDQQKTRTIWENRGKIIFKGQTNIGHGSRICVGKTGLLSFGEFFAITAESSIICFHKISFGASCLLSWQILMMDTDFHKVYHDQKLINEDQPIEIGDKVWIGARCVIQKGANIGSGSIVAAGAVVTGKFSQQNVVLGGTPAKIINTDIRWTI